MLILPGQRREWLVSAFSCGLNGLNGSASTAQGSDGLNGLPACRRFVDRWGTVAVGLGQLGLMHELQCFEPL